MFARALALFLTMMCALLIVTPEADATCIEYEDGSYECWAGPPVDDIDRQDNPPQSAVHATQVNEETDDALRWHMTFAFGHSSLFGQAEEVLDAAAVGGRISTGLAYGDWGADFIFHGTDMTNAFDDPLSSFSVGGALERAFTVWRLDEEIRLAATAHVGGSSVTLSSSELGEFSGGALNVGGGLRFEVLSFDDGGLDFRVVANVNHEWLWLKNEERERHINGVILHPTLGVGMGW